MFSLKINSKINNSSLRRIIEIQKQEISPHYQIVFSIVAIAFYFQPYIYWIAESHYTYSISICKTIATWFCAIFLCIFHYLKEYPAKSYIISISWYLMILYCLPVISTFCLLTSKFDSFWQINSIFSNLMLSIITSWPTFIILNIIGTILGFVIYYNQTHDNEIFFLVNEQSVVIYNYIFSISVCYILIYAKQYHVRLLSRVKDKLSFINHSLQNKVNRKTHYLKSSLMDKENFINNISHEMRTPMQGIYGITQDLVENWSTMSEEKKLNHLNLVSKSSERLISLFCDLLDLGKINANQMKMNFEKGDFQELITSIISEMEPISIAKNTPIILKKNNNINCITQFDRIRMKQVIRNLIGNALKYSTQGTIQISINYDDYKCDTLLIQIQDQGIGIPENELNIIFLPFRQSTKTKTTAGGTGLGLSICAEIVNLHHGKIWAKNNPQVGASFFFTLPIISQNTQTINKIITKINELGSVMILDDENLSLESGSIILSSIGLNVMVASDCKNCLNQLKANKISILFLDMMLPDMSGIEFLKILRNDPEFDQLIVIIVSGICDIKTINEAIRIGALTHFSKPYNKAQILDVISRSFQYLI